MSDDNYPPEGDEFFRMFSNFFGSPEQMNHYLRQVGDFLRMTPKDGADWAQIVTAAHRHLESLASGNENVSTAEPDRPRNEETSHLQTDSLKGTQLHPSPLTSRDIADGFRLVDSWVDNVTSLPSVTLSAQSWTPRQWIDRSAPVWQAIADPIINSLADALTSLLTADDMPKDMGIFSQLRQAFAPFMRETAGAIYGEHLAKAMAHLAMKVLSASDIGIQILDRPTVAIMPETIDTYAQSIECDSHDVLLYVLIREDARQRLYAHASWLGPQLLRLLEEYARDITIDLEKLHDVFDITGISDITPQKMQELTGELEGRLFSPTPTEEQKGILARLETLISLSEGWVDHITHEVARTWLSHESALRESMRRRRATDGPTETFFTTLVGLDLRARRLRDATNLWAAIDSSWSLEQRDALWNHPDVLPDSRALDDPLGFLAPTKRDSVDEELDHLLGREHEDD